ncbi:histone-lysine N-methyltransferase SETMAR [Trichonephila clavipes]|nr:histone-lysine N-methyltransferase SETMAR [Trichonephila clavipes]
MNRVIGTAKELVQYAQSLTAQMWNSVFAKDLRISEDLLLCSSFIPLLQYIGDCGSPVVKAYHLNWTSSNVPQRPMVTYTEMGMFRRFRSDLFDVKDAPHTGRPVVENVDKMTEKIEVDRHVSSCSIAQKLKIDHKTVLSHLRKVGFKKKLDD